MNRAFWSAKRVFVTGHSGFKGAWLSLWLRRLGAAVVGYSLDPPSQPNLFDLAGVAAGMRSLRGDVRDLERLLAAMRPAEPEIVFHLAAQPLVRPSYHDPVGTYATNVMGTVHVLEAVRRTGSVKAVVIVTSDKCYQNREWIWGYREDEPMGGHDPYSGSKACAELVTQTYVTSFFGPDAVPPRPVGVASARAGNVIGGGDWAVDRLVPDCMSALLRQEPIVIRCPGAVRPWQHVLEPLLGYLLLAERLYRDGAAFGGGWNFGPNDDDASPVGTVVEQIVARWGHGARASIDEGPHPHEAHYLKLDCSKAKARLGWAPRWSLPIALEKTVEWYTAYNRHENILDLTLSQIDSYAAHVS